MKIKNKKIAELFEDIVGLDSVKENVQSIINNIKLEKLRDPNKKIIPGHYVFQGNPGTGKTTIARILFDAFKEMELIADEGKLVEVTRPDLVSMAIGGTAEKTAKVLNSALGGILFIDEAYSLVGEGKDVGEEAIETIVPFMENNKDKFTLIVAGYTEDMIDFLAQNTGLKSRFDFTINFEDYTIDELMEIFHIFAKQRNMKIAKDVLPALETIFKYKKRNARHFGNARTVRKIFKACVSMLNNRLTPIIDELEAHDSRLFYLTLEDIPKEYNWLVKNEGISEENIDEAYSNFDNIIGLNSVKTRVLDIIDKIQVAKRRKKNSQIFPGHYIFQGNPGTGKTMVANLMDDIFKSLHILQRGHIISVTREDLVGNYIGHTATKTKKVLESALGGVLFIDEAYSLVSGNGGSGSDFGQEAIDTIVPFMENHREEFMLIVAGYPQDISKLLDANSGLRSRFTHTIDFEDYNSSDMVEIFLIFLKDAGYHLEAGVLNTLRIIFQSKIDKAEHFGNGRDVRKIFYKICENMDNRIADDLSISDDYRLNLIKQVDLMDIKI